MVKKTERGKKKGVVDAVVNRGAWTAMEDQKLVEYVRAHGDKNWRTLPAKAGLNRCGKSCRLRWLNYLRPGIKRGNISDEEEDLIIRLHNLIGNRWSLIAGRLPGRTDNEIKNHWNTHLSRRSVTIDDLNHKMNQNIESARGHACAHLAIPFASTHGFAATMGAAVDNVDDDWALDATAEPLQLSSELCRSELDMEQLFDLMPNLDGGQFGVEAYYGARGEAGYHDLLASEVSGTQAVWDASGFDDLDRFLGCEDLIAFSFLD